MATTTQDADVWNAEYDSLQVIPSSTRTAPSKALALFSELIDFGTYNKVLDAGCGNGRNSVYLAEKGCDVHAVDSADSALDRLKKLALAHGVANRISLYLQSLQPTFSFDTGEFDLVLDSYVFCHVVDDDLREKYRSELHRVTRPGGLVYSSVFSVEDEYYQSIGHFEPSASNIVTDPHNGIRKRLYTRRELKRFLSDQFEILYFVQFDFQDRVLDCSYNRSILASVLKRPP